MFAAESASAPPSCVGTLPRPVGRTASVPVALISVCAAGAAVTPAAVRVKLPPTASAPEPWPITAPDTVACVEPNPFTASALGPRSSCPPTSDKVAAAGPAVAAAVELPAPSAISRRAPSATSTPARSLRLEPSSVKDCSDAAPSAAIPSRVPVRKSMAPVLARRTDPAASSCVATAGLIDSASVVAVPDGTNAMLDEPSDHSAPVPVRVPFSETPPRASTESEPREAMVAPASIATVPAPLDAVPAVRSGISQFKSDTDNSAGAEPPELESVTDCMSGRAVGAVPDAADVDCSVAPLSTSID